MALTPGSRIGSYQISGLLGEGGMGQVWRATDTTLGRQVAIKILPDAFAADPDRLARFEREAKALAALNHPNIAQIYGLEVGPAAGLAEGTAAASGSSRTRALVMEFVEGDDLAERLKRGAIAIEEALSIAKQIAEALGAAHDAGIVHRDLKPANIKVRPDGTVKVLDFGLAKAMDQGSGIRDQGSGGAANSPTITNPGAMTQAGVFLGTAAYMAPEQARGAGVDKRADIWAYGVVFYEMLTGTRLFEGETVSDIIANVLKTDVEWSRLPADTPAAVRRLLRRCLTRDRKQRLQDIGDASLELSEAGAALDSVSSSTASPGRAAWLRMAATFVAGVAVTLAGSAAWLSRGAPVSDGGRPYTFLITPADGVVLEDPPNFAVSPDGRHILLKGFDVGVPYWYVKNLESGALRRLNSTQGASMAAAWSPDSGGILFSRRSVLTKVAIDDTRMEEMGNLGATPFASFSWSPSGDVLAATVGGLLAFRGSGVAPRTVIEAGETFRALQYPWVLPGGSQMLVGDVGDATYGIFLAKVDGSEPPRAVEQGRQPAFADLGWLLAVRGEQLLAWRFDADQGVTQPPEVVLSGIQIRGGLAGRVFSVSQTGVLAVRNDAASEVTHLTWFDRTGAEGAQLKLSRHCRNPEFSRDHQRLAMECYEGSANNRDIWLYDLARDAASRFTLDQSDDADPVWSPDGKTIAFSSNRLGAVDVFRKSTGGATGDELMIETPGSTPVMAWSPDGKTIAVLQTSAGTDLLGYDVGSNATSKPIVASPFTELELQFSPDGRFISYSSDESGRAEIYVQRWPQTGEKWQVSTDGATDARWRGDGRELFYVSPTRDLMAVSIDTRNGFRAGTPVRLFQTRVAGPLGSGHRFPYAVSADGQRFVIYVNDKNAPPPSIKVIVNWPALLKQ